MHHSSFEKMRAFRDSYLRDREGMATEILDVGSASFAEDDGNRPLFDDSAWTGDELRGLDVRKIKVELIKQSLRRARKIFRTPMGRLERL